MSMVDARVKVGVTARPVGDVNALDCPCVLHDLVASRSGTLVTVQHCETIPGQPQVLLLVSTDMGTSEVYQMNQASDH